MRIFRRFVQFRQSDITKADEGEELIAVRLEIHNTRTERERLPLTKLKWFPYIRN